MSDQNLRHFEDIVPGETHRSDTYKITREDIVEFAKSYDPQAFHLDDAVAAASPLEGLAASGWHTTAIGMNLYYNGFVKHVAGMGAPGIDEVRWLRPVRPGDDLTLTIKVPSTRPSSSRADRGFISVVFEMRNGADEIVMSQRFSMIVQRQGAVQDVRVPRIPESAVAPEALPEVPVDIKLGGFPDESELNVPIELGAQHFSAERIVEFAKKFDPQYFHLDPERAKTSHFGGLIASGWQTGALWMKSWITARDRSVELRRSRGLPVPIPGPSPGFSNLKWIRPVHAGETIHYQTTVTGYRSLPRPGWCLQESLNTGRAADGTVVFSFEGRTLWPLAPQG